MEIINVPIKELIFNEKNPRKISDKELSKLMRSIETFGFVDPVYCQVIIDRFEKLTGKKAVKV